MAKKFTDLTATTNLTDGDIFAIVDDAGNSTSRSVNADTVSNYVLSLSKLNTETNRGNIINAINSQATVTNNNLQAGKIFFNNSYSELKDVMKYANLPDAPTAVTSNAQISNDMFYSGLQFQDGAYRLKVKNAASQPEGIPNPIASEIFVNTDMIQEGLVNKFFNDAEIETKLETIFPSQFNKYSNSFDGGDVADSVQDVLGVWNPIGGESGTTSRSIRVSNTHKSNFKVGQVLRVYGCNSTDASAPSAAATALAPISATGFTTTVGSFNTLEFQYKIAPFNLATGQIGQREATRSIVFTTSNATEQTSQNDIYNAFNLNNFLSLSITKSSTDGILVYRRVGTSGPFKLISVLGPKDLPSNGGTFVDYYTFDYVSWSGKNELDNSYIETDPETGERLLTHFPATLAGDETITTTYAGWADLAITDIVENTDNFDIVFGDTPVFINGISHPQQNNAYIAHNNTATIESAISDKSATGTGTKRVQFNAKTYNVSSIAIPDDFGLIGVPGVTKIKKLPWSTYPNPNEASAFTPILRTSNPGACKNVSLVGLIFDGNNRNQYLLNDSGGLSINTFVNFDVASSNVLIDNCIFENIAGDGIYASSPIDLKMINSEVSNSGVSDRLPSRSPLVIDDGENTMVNGNIFKNFTDSIDASVTKGGSVIANNVIKNCGSGLFIYGATFLVSSPNVMMGPANEFLSTPDVLNSEYDSVNILRSRITQQLQGGTPVESDVFAYQENGEIFDLTQSSVGTPEIIFRANMVRKYRPAADSPDDTAEEFYGHLIGPGAKDINDQAFSITSSAATNVALVTGQRYTIVDLGTDANTATDWTRAGAAVNKTGVQFTYNGATLVKKSAHPGSGTPTTGTVTPDEFVGYKNTVAIPSQGVTIGVKPKISITNYTGGSVDGQPVLPENGQFQYQIDNTNAQALTSLHYTRGHLTDLYNSRVKQSATDSTSGRIHPFNSYHVGVAYSASYRNAVRVGDITDQGFWGYTLADGSQQPGVGNGVVGYFDATTGLDHLGKNADGTDANAASGNMSAIMNTNRVYRDFKVTVQNFQHLAVGRAVTVDNHGTFNTGATLKDFGIIVDIQPDTATTKKVIIRYFGEYFGTTYTNMGVTPHSTQSSLTGSSNFLPYDATAADDIIGQKNGGGSASGGTLNIIDDFVMAQGLIK